MQLLQCLIILTICINFNYQKNDVAPNWNNNHIKVQQAPTFHLANMAWTFMTLQLKFVIACAYVAWSFMISFMTKM